jgi:hypothetical protein
VRLSKRDYWLQTYEARKQAFTIKNIQSAWGKTSVYPYDPRKVLSTFEIPQETTSQSVKKLKHQSLHKVSVVHLSSFKKVMLMRSKDPAPHKWKAYG